MKATIAKKLLVAALCGGGSLCALADLPFRNHMFDSFKSLPVNEKSIVFYGNSITNMHEWWECFGENHNVLNRGVSGGYSQELLDNVESIIAGRPAKVFLMIGTNDLGTKDIDKPQLVAANIRRIIERIQSESPATQIYIQSILPTVNGIRTLEKTVDTNKLLQRICQETGVTYVDLYQPMIGIVLNELSYDKLHLNAAGYKIWGDIAAPYVGTACSYPEKYEDNNSGMKNSQGMRSTCMGVQKVHKGDVLFVGDDMIHGGEWHELFNSASMKDRGTGWGYYSMTLGQWESMIEAMLHTNPDRKEAPRMIVLNIGLNDLNSKKPLPEIKDAYRKVIDKIRSYAPASKTKIVITAQLPRTDAKHNETRVQPFNALLKELASEVDNAKYVDIYTPMTDANNTADQTLMNGDYVYAAGYNKIAQTLAPVIGKGAKPMKASKAKEWYDYVEARTRLGKQVEAAVKKLAKVDSPELSRELGSAQALLASKRPTVKQLDAATAALLQLL